MEQKADESAIAQVIFALDKIKVVVQGVVIKGDGILALFKVLN